MELKVQMVENKESKSGKKYQNLFVDLNGLVGRIYNGTGKLYKVGDLVNIKIVVDSYNGGTLKVVVAE